MAEDNDTPGASFTVGDVWLSFQVALLDICQLLWGRGTQLAPECSASEGNGAFDGLSLKIPLTSEALFMCRLEAGHEVLPV